MRHSVTPPAFTASSGLDVAVVSSSSVVPEPARASRERKKKIEDVILVKFVLLVSVHTTSDNGAQFSEASNFRVLLCLNVLQWCWYIFSVHSGNDSLNVSFSSIIRFQSHSSNEGRDGRQRQVKVGMVVSCRIGTAVLRWQ